MVSGKPLPRMYKALVPSSKLQREREREREREERKKGAEGKGRGITSV